MKITKILIAAILFGSLLSFSACSDDSENIVPKVKNDQAENLTTGPGGISIGPK